MMDTMKQGPIEFADAPGTIVHDFQAMVNIVGPEGLRITGEMGLFPIDHLEQLDARLARPLKPELKRPQLRSYPNISGLYMLLRSSGMGLLQKAKGGTRRLVLDDALARRWGELSPADRYWNLLGVWLVLAQEPGERPPRSALQELSLIIHGLDRTEKSIYGGWASQYTLMAMFGMIQLHELRRGAQGSWDCRYDVLPLGRRLQALLTEEDFIMRLVMLHVDEMTSPARSLRLFREQLGAIAPQWRELLLIEKPIERFVGTFTINVSLDKNVWRRFAVPSDATLHDLAIAILKAYRFDDDHLYEFRIETPTGAMVEYTDPRMGEGIPAMETELGSMGLSAGQEFIFHYDFGDDWIFDVQIEAMEDRKSKAVRMVESNGKAPEQYPDWGE